MQVQVRLGDEKDLPFIRKLALERCASSVPPGREISIEAVRANIDRVLAMWPKLAPKIPYLRTLIAEAKETRTPLGYLILHLDQLEATTGEVEAIVQDIAVEPKFEGKQVWRSLMKKAEEIAREHRNQYLVAMITTTNKTSLLVAQRYGLQIERYQLVKRL